MRALRTVTLLIALAGASTAHADDKTKETPLAAADVEKLLAFFDELVDASVKHASDCKALAGAVDGVVTRHLETVKMSWAAKEEKKTLPKEAQARMDKRGVELVGALRACLGDADVKKAFARMKPPPKEEAKQAK